MVVHVANILNEVERLPEYRIFGRVAAIVGLLVEVEGVQESLSIGDHCRIIGRSGRIVTCEVVGFRNARALLLPFDSLDGVGLGCRAEAGATAPHIYPCEGWLGRVVDAFGRPLDRLGPLPSGGWAYPIHAPPPPR